MDEMVNDGEMPIPNYAVGTRILLVDSDMTSLSQTTSILEETTYQVTSTAFPNVAISVMQERANEYDLVVAAMRMHGMDCLTFLRIVKTLSDIPVVLTSHKTDEQLAIRTIQQGACHFFEKPISREDAQGLWQFVFRKGRKKCGINEVRNVQNELHQVDSMEISKGKSKESKFPTKDLLFANQVTGNQVNNQVIRKRKRSVYGDEQTEKDIGCIPEDILGIQKKQNAKSVKNHVEWNHELHTRLMNSPVTDPRPHSRKSVSSTAAGARQSHVSVQEHAGQSQRFNSKSHMFHNTTLYVEKYVSRSSLLGNIGNQLEVNETTDEQLYLKGRIDQIRHAYWTNNESEKTGSVSRHENVLGVGADVNCNSRCDGSSTMNLRLSPEKYVFPAGQNYVQPNLPSASKLQVEETGLVQASNFLFTDSDNSVLLTDGSAYQAINSSENGLQLARTSNILQCTATDDDIFFDEMLNQIQSDFTNNDLKSLGFSSSS